MAAAAAAPAAADPQRPQASFRFSRYRRSLRNPPPALQDTHTHTRTPPPPMPPPTEQSSTMAALSRSMSRYHTKRPPASAAAPPPPVPISVARAPTHRSNPLPSARSRAANLPSGPTAAPARDDDDQDDRQYTEAAREEAMRLLEGDSAPSANAHAQLKAEKRAKLEEAERLKAKQISEEHERRKEERIRKYHEKKAEDLRAREFKARQEAIRQAQQEEEQRQDEMECERWPTPKNVHERHSRSPPSPSPDSDHKRERLGLLRKRRDESPTQPVQVPAAPRSRQVSNEPADPVTIKPGGGGVVPGTDAPVSAVNSGDRRVMVECNSQKILLPVTPDTTCMDLIRSAANVLSESIDTQASVLLEFFSKCGVQRPLRKYERIRDVLNSWDTDRQNSLVLIESPTGGRDHDLSVGSVPEAKPTGQSCFMYYSQKPGKWSKRFVTVQTNGQLTWAKNDSGKDTTVICHLSDFDIYTPTPSQQRKIKPPKKYCFAVKSQQRSSMFEATSSYVHFFSTSHKDNAADFFSSVQGWRSWYLVRVMGEGQKKPKAGDQLALNLTSTRKVSGTHGQTQETSKALRRPHTSDSTHYQIGSFKPFFDATSFEPTSTPELNLQHPKVPSPPDRIMSMRKRSHPPVSYQNNSRLNSLSANNTSSDEEGPFSSGGLLGRTYSQRQRVAAQRDAAARNAGPYGDGPSLLNNLSSSVPSRSSMDESARPQRINSVRSTRGSAQAEPPRRTNTTRMPKPLIDLTPQYQAPPQFQKKGKGFNPASVGSGGLIDSATSPDVAIPVPPSKDWRARAGGSHPRPTTSGGVDRMKSVRAPGMKHNGAIGAMNNHNLVPQSDADAFTGGGLIAKTSWGPTSKGQPLGRGVIDGTKAKGPLLDVSDSSRFVPGSLLADVAAKHPSAPIISRE